MKPRDRPFGARKPTWYVRSAREKRWERQVHWGKAQTSRKAFFFDMRNVDKAHSITFQEVQCMNGVDYGASPSHVRPIDRSRQEVIGWNETSRTLLEEISALVLADSPC